MRTNAYVRGIVPTITLSLVLSGCGLAPDSSNDPGAGRGLPALTGVVALSRHYVEVSFASDVGVGALDASAYTIANGDGGAIVVQSVELQDDASRVLLITDSQFAVNYTLSVSTEDTASGGTESATFRGSAVIEPYVESAVAVNPTTVLVTFSEVLDAASTESAGAYNIRRAGTNAQVVLEVVSTAQGSDAGSVLLTTEPQDAVDYRLTVKGVLTQRGRVRELLIDPTGNEVTFAGMSTVDTVRPRLVSAQAVSPMSLAVSFSEALDAEADDATHYIIEPALAVAAVEPSSQRSQMILTTGRQTPGRSYTLTVVGVRDAAGNAIDPVENVTTFAGTARELFLESAVALSSTSVLATFSEPPDPNTALNARFFDIESMDGGAGPSVVGVTVDSENDRAIVLTTTDQQNRSYRLRATNVTARADGFPIDPSRNMSTFVGIESEDSTGPDLLRADSTSSTTVLLTFNEPLVDDAADPVNFAITCSTCADAFLQVLDANLTRHNTQIVLETHPQEAGAEYRATASNENGHLTDQSVNRNPIAPDPSTATFVFSGQPALAPAVVLPRVVGAISLGNTSVLVTFSKPMGDSTLALANYAIVQENVNSEVGSLAVLNDACAPGSVQAGQPCVSNDDCLNGTCLLRAPRFLGSDRTAVVLTTSSQNEVTYRVSVVNVRDLAGNQLAPKELLVDPTSATFAGTPGGGVQGPIVDSDADGLSDASETRGRVITVVLSNGEVTQTEVTSDPFAADTDGDGLDDGEERRLNTNPRSSDTDGDQLSDPAEYNVWFTSPTHQDTDADGLDDYLEVDFFRTSPLVEDTDGDGLLDGAETITGNRNPRVADLPDPGIEIGQVALRLDTRFDYTDTQGEANSVAKSTSATLSESDARTLATSDTSTTEHAINASAEFGYEGGVTPKATFKASVGYGYTRGNSFTASESSTRETQNQYQDSLQTTVSRDVTQSVTRSVEGASVEVLVTINNGGDIPFTIRNLQLTGLLQNPFDRSRFLPVATMLPAAVLEGGGDFEVFLGPFIPQRGPFIFKNTEVFPSLVEDLMKNPRGLIFTVANFDIEDEDGRNFAFISQDVNDRTAGIIVDYGDGTVDRFRVSTHSPFGADGRQEGISMAYAMQDILGLSKNESVNAITIGPNACGETWAVGDDIQVAEPICLPVAVGGLIVLPGPNGVLDSVPAGDDRKSPLGDMILDGGDGCAQTRASRDDVQFVPGDCESAFPDGIMVLPGPDGVFQTEAAGDDVAQTVTGYGTEPSGACDGNTDIFIAAGRNELLDSTPAGDDEVLQNVILPGDNDILETTIAGDDVRQGPGIDCESDEDCPGEGMCKSVERVTRVKAVENVPSERRFWIILSDADIPAGTGFDDIRLRAGDTFSLAYVQDKDDDGLIAREEFLFGSSDRDVNSDGCPLGDGAPGCDTTVFEFDTVRDFEEVKQGWTVQIEGRSSYATHSNPILPDSDADRLFDDEEEILGTDPGKRDSDDDEISDYDEVRGYDTTRRDGVLIRHVVPYQSAKITSGDDGMLDTLVIGDDVLSELIEVITPGPNGVLDSVPEGDDEIEPTRLILDGGNGIPESVASGDDVQVGPSPFSTATVTVTYLDFSANGDACDGLQDGEFTFDLRLRRNIETLVGQYQQNSPVKRNVSHAFDGVIVGGANGVAETEAQGDDLQVTVVGNNIAPDELVVSPGPNGILDSLPVGDDEIVGPADGGNSFDVALEPGDSISLSGVVRERDDVCDTNTRRAVIEAGLAIAEPHTGGNGIADSMIPITPDGLPLNDDIQEVLPGQGVQPGQVIISAGPNGVVDTAPGGDDVIPFGNGFADTSALEGDEQVVELSGMVESGDVIVSCGVNGEPAMGMAPAVPGICEAVIVRTANGDGTADTSALGDDIQVQTQGSPVFAGTVVVRAGPNGMIDSVPAGADEDIVDAHAPLACEAVIVEAISNGNGVAETSAGDDDEQFIAVGAPVAAGESIIGPGTNGVIDSIAAQQVIVEPSEGDGTVGTTAGGDDVQVRAVDSAVSAGDLIIGPGPNGVIDSTPGGDDATADADDVLFAAHPPQNGDCTTCPLGDCGLDCTLCATGTCVGDDVLIVRTPGQPCDDGFCPCGSCVTGLVEEWALSPQSFTLEELLSLTSETGRTTITFAKGPGCFGGAQLRVLIEVDLGVMVSPGAVLVRPGANGQLDSEASGDDIVGVSHLFLYATNPLDRDTDGDTLFDGAERILGANPNDPLDASRFRDTDLDGLANVEEDDGWFIGYRDENSPERPLQCRTVDGTFVLVLDELDPPEDCVFVSSDRFEPDTDFDGLPDLLEQLIRSNPNNVDTDGDGLLDYDEFDPGSRFSVDVAVFREFERHCGEADRCTYDPPEAPYGTSVVLSDTDFDGRSDREEIFESWIILPCVGGDQLPMEVFSSPLSPDADHDGVLDGAEQDQGTDPANPDTDGDGMVDNPLVDPQPDGCGKVTTVSFVDYRTRDDCDGSGGDGEFRFRFTVVTPRGNFSFNQNNDDLDDNRTHTFSSNSAVFLLTPGETFRISGHVYEADGAGNANEDWYFGRTYRYETLPSGSTIISPLPGEADSSCFDGHQLQVSITSTGA